MLIDALERLAGARGASRLTADVSDSAQGFFQRRGYVGQTRNSVPRGGEWLANTTMEKRLAEEEKAR
jgi:putative acetyltransferase